MAARRFTLCASLLAALSCSAAATPCAETLHVKLGGVLGERFAKTISANVLQLDMARDFYAPFRARKATDGFIGLGKHADAAVHFAKNSGDPAVLAHKNAVVSFLIDNQLPDGYTGFFAPEARLGKLWDIHEMGFIVQALMADWELFGNKRALEAARKNADYVIDRWAQMPPNWEFTFITDRETTLGFGYGVARLYAATKDEKYRSFLRRQRALDDWNDPIVIGRDKMIYGQAYGYTGTCLEQLELHRWDPRDRYLETSRRALAFQTKGDGVLIDGNGGICECWTNDQDGEGSVGETCNVCFELLFWDALAQQGVADEALLGDLTERAVYNALLAAQSEDGRRLRYYTPLNGVRKFWHNDVYCCPNNFRRAMARLPEYVFRLRKDAKSVSTILYSACETAFELDGAHVALREETDYPKTGRVKIAVDPDRDVFFSLKVRLPAWCRAPEASVNGMRVTYKCKPGQMLAVPRVWRKGDVVELDFPMDVRTVRGRKRQSGRFAVMRGPVVYALDTRAIPAFKNVSPHEAQTILMMDPNRLAYDAKTGVIDAVVSTVEYAVGVADLSVDGKPPDNVACVRLWPFWRESNTLTYFRAPNLEDDCREEDELFGPSSLR